EKNGDPFISVPFPPQISSLRTALEGQKPNQPPMSPQLRSPDVPETSEGNEQRVDALPTFSTRSTSYDQLILDGLLSKVGADGAPYLGIAASDVSDFVRDNSPNTTLFTLSSDLRLLRQAVNANLYGMLVFSTH